jgi:glutathione S-transferase
MSILLYGAGASPFVRKVRVVLAEKNIPYAHEQLVPINVSPEYRQISPLGKIPALRDGDRTLADSSVICAYLERRHPEPALYPADPYQYARALWFEEYGDTALVDVIGRKIFFPKFVAPRFLNQAVDEAAVEHALRNDLPPLFDYVESQLGTDPFLAGRSFSIGDIGIATHLVNLRHCGIGVDAGRWPKLARWAAAVHERPSFRALIDEDRQAFGVE